MTCVMQCFHNIPKEAWWNGGRDVGMLHRYFIKYLQCAGLLSFFILQNVDYILNIKNHTAIASLLAFYFCPYCIYYLSFKLPIWLKKIYSKHNKHAIISHFINFHPRLTVMSFPTFVFNQKRTSKIQKHISPSQKRYFE